MGKLAVALARECIFGVDVMKSGSVGGKGPGTTQLPSRGMGEICAIFTVLHLPQQPVKI
jgi:hypothetical protein